MWFFCWYSDLILQTQRHPAHSGASRLTHPYKYIFRTTVTCSQQLSLLHWMNNSLIPKNFSTIPFSVQKLFTYKSHICWLDAIRLGSSCETQTVLIEIV